MGAEFISTSHHCYPRFSYTAMMNHGNHLEAVFMNRCYRIAWNHRKGVWQAISEPGISTKNSLANMLLAEQLRWSTE
ncbi:ESPR-type extended signal peptide-containing protein [Halomonas sp. N3-2A]|uniref:ESPR-type extended signal peptide-containing protein n=1 Tax=Halomonas sp. N3-2A TaxID=2014541 RepID=UPI000B5B1689|nr:hypothetical protein CEK60_02225 [Halomonas sp. N3-2A]